MQVILIEDVNKLGKLGDVVDVKKGYARNFLLPHNLAIEATENGLKFLEERKLSLDIHLSLSIQEEGVRGWGHPISIEGEWGLKT